MPPKRKEGFQFLEPGRHDMSKKDSKDQEPAQIPDWLRRFVTPWPGPDASEEERRAHREALSRSLHFSKERAVNRYFECLENLRPEDISEDEEEESSE